ncbi:uncharacterized protein MONBRDRAFT_19517 [Monosiga brevicollis MX1]|uniref:non-specific serine/threonine protein kinase n=1 Tax=Monosiga brevicollis TaxID=81824 RepID=A9US03_MONBE|nr:uncharacterized protein MONBRDRAFT_19517 [Monosiga brevicollis MX1]EDQ92017.1 predicted protein [Monosiga brevicollis MX1]|eukprot:XP_001743303.1 hypothetical protein [Monosiga brevicollis MX1]
MAAQAGTGDVGSLQHETYEAIRILGRGACSTAFLCRHRQHGSLAVVKQVELEDLPPAEREKALTEVELLGMVQHPNVIRYFDHLLQPRGLYIAMEYAPGGTLDDFIAQQSKPLPEAVVVRFLAQLLLALQALHERGIVHRDCKPNNIFLDDRQQMLKLADFGISRLVPAATFKASTLGTPNYMAPELLEGRMYTQKSDVWALGCIVAEMCNRKRAFEAPNVSALTLLITSDKPVVLDKSYSAWLQGVVRACLHSQSDQRPAIAHILSQPELQNALVDVQLL